MIKPIIGVTMGDPFGIRAEIIVKALAQRQVRDSGRFVIFGSSEQFSYLADSLELDLPFHREHHEDIRRFPGDLTVLDYDEISIPAAGPRGPSKIGGQASMAFCQDAIAAIKGGFIDAIVTAPISKASWDLAGFGKYGGHTELLAEKFKAATCR